MTSILKLNVPTLIEGGLGIDDRGHVLFINDFNFDGVKRFYVVSNHRQGFIRAWHAHKSEGKYVSVVQGAALVCAVKIDDWDSPSRDLQVYRYTLSSNKPAVLFIPPGYGNGFMSLTQDAQLAFFSTSSLEDSAKDDFRFEAHYWNPWIINER